MTDFFQPRILVVDDEPRYVRTLRTILEAAGYQTAGTSDPTEAVKMVLEQEPNLILLDVIMPKLGGLELCQRIREFSTIPIIMLTALAQKNQVVKGLDAGADDYIAKPFSADELLARVRSALRRAGFGEHTQLEALFDLGEFRIDYARCEVQVSGMDVHLTPTEYRILRELSRTPEKIISSAELLGKVWGEEYSGEEQLVARVIHRLRQKIEPDAAHPCYILTRPGLGYLLRPGGRRN